VSALPVTVSVAESPAQTEALFTLICGRGFTMMLIVCEADTQPFSVALTDIVAVCVVVPLLMALKLVILPVPEAASPMEVLLLVQLMTALVGLAVKLILPVGCVAHTTTLFEGIVNTGGLGSVNVIGPIILEVQPLSVTEILS
jgi:type III secretory pathway component EscU